MHGQERNINAPSTRMGWDSKLVPWALAHCPKLCMPNTRAETRYPCSCETLPLSIMSNVGRRWYQNPQRRYILGQMRGKVEGMAALPPVPLLCFFKAVVAGRERRGQKEILDGTSHNQPPSCIHSIEKPMHEKINQQGMFQGHVYLSFALIFDWYVKNCSVWSPRDGSPSSHATGLFSPDPSHLTVPLRL